jgi:hypothetical protein
MDINQKLQKVSDNFTINMYDNGFMVEISGKDSADDWTTAKIICRSNEELLELINTITTMERDT